MIVALDQSLKYRLVTKYVKLGDNQRAPQVLSIDDNDKFCDVDMSTTNSGLVFEVSERDMGMKERSAMSTAKSDELQSFFDNQVWLHTKTIDEDRTLKARFVLTWKQDDSGKDIAKARLVIQGYNDPDALQGKLEVSSPTGTRLSRQLLLLEASVRRWNIESADVKTAFLQSAPKDRSLYVRLPRDAARIMQIEKFPYMKLVKPMYGQIEAPREWFKEATRRLIKCEFTVHPLDPCFFMAFKQNQLVGLVHLHVDDMLVAGDSHAGFQDFKDRLQKTFKFGKWISDKITYCGGQITQEKNHVSLSFCDYVRKNQTDPGSYWKSTRKFV